MSLYFPNTSGLLQYSVTLAVIDSDTSADDVVKRTINCELLDAVEQVRYYYHGMLVWNDNSLVLIPLCLNKGMPI